MARLMADRMLKGLAQRLRLIGYDCAIASEDACSIEAILKQARTEERLLVTACRRWRGRQQPPEDVIAVPPEDLPDQVKAVLARAPINHAAQAFTRCSIDNTPLEFFAFETMQAQLPPLVRQMRPDPVSRCPHCGRLYWPGTHTQRVRAELAAWLREMARK